TIRLVGRIEPASVGGPSTGQTGAGTASGVGFATFLEWRLADTCVVPAAALAGRAPRTESCAPAAGASDIEPAAIQRARSRSERILMAGLIRRRVGLTVTTGGTQREH